MRTVSRPPSNAARPRIARLSVLPVFLDLAGKRAVVAGGSAGAAWKAELLAAAGARVEVYTAGDLSCEMAGLAARLDAVALHDHRWDAACLHGAAVAVADAAEDAEAGDFEAAARAAGAACNVIDRPAFCHFQFGSIVNRSPVVIGISTSGAAPILGQAVRRRIEALLPQALAEWAALARRLRERVAERLAPGAARRAFWERLVDRAFGPAPKAASDDVLMNELAAMRPAAPCGHVTFVGAGPGDAELLTLKAVRALQAADVILFDDIVPDAVLEMARREAQRIAVGRRDDAAAMAIGLARSGRRVVRLLHGDPSVPGHAGAEMAELEAAGIGCDVVPGVAPIMPRSGQAGRAGAVAKPAYNEVQASIRIPDATYVSA